MRRREFITLLGSIAAWPSVGRAQQLAIPLVGVLGSASTEYRSALNKGLNESGFVEDQNVRIEYRWAGGAYDRLAALADELVRLRISVIAALGTPAALVAKAAAAKISPAIPVIFVLGSDPVAEELVTSFNKPGGNVTGATTIAGSLIPKRLELIRPFLTSEAVIAILINPDNPLSQIQQRDAEAASRAIGQRLEVLTARNDGEINGAFERLEQQHIAGLIVGIDTVYLGQIQRIAALAAQRRMPAIAPVREFATAGGLMSYGPSISDSVRQAGVYVGKVLKGMRPADLPVVQPTKFELVINTRAARELGLTVPPSLLATADEVIE
jgi:putative tryptophan/tyrosine transport system substrate-binding protein